MDIYIYMYIYIYIYTYIYIYIERERDDDRHATSTRDPLNLNMTESGDPLQVLTAELAAFRLGLFVQMALQLLQLLDPSVNSYV